TREEPLSEDDLARAAGLAEAAGGKTWTENEAGTQVGARHRSPADTDRPGDSRAEFAGIAGFSPRPPWESGPGGEGGGVDGGAPSAAAGPGRHRPGAGPGPRPRPPARPPARAGLVAGRARDQRHHGR